MSKKHTHRHIQKQVKILINLRLLFEGDHTKSECRHL